MSALVSRALTGQFTMTGNFVMQGSVTIGITATAIPLGSIITPHWCFLFNTDPTNYVTIRNGALGTDLLQIMAGEPAVCPLKTDSVPHGLANTAPIELEYLLFSL